MGRGLRGMNCLLRREKGAARVSVSEKQTKGCVGEVGEEREEGEDVHSWLRWWGDGVGRGGDVVLVAKTE